MSARRQTILPSWTFPRGRLRTLAGMGCWCLLWLEPEFAPAAQTIPAARTFGQAWQGSGYPGELPAPATIVNVQSFGALGDGVANDYPAMAAAIASLGGQPGVVYFPAGIYLIQSQVQLPSGVVLRGERSHNTTLRFDFVSHCIWVNQAPGGAFQPVTGGAVIHSDTIEVSDGGAFAPGDYAEIREDNDPAWGASDWATKVVGQILRVASVAGNTLTLERPLRITYPAGQNPEIRKVTLKTNVGIENLKLERLLAGDATQRDNKFTIGFRYAANCWVRGVECYNGFGGHVGIQYGSNIEVTGCYIHHAHEYDGGGSGYGVRLEFSTGDCLTENNIFQSLRHSMLLQAGVNGNVFGYNYSREPKRTEFPSELSSDITIHGNYPYANLFEGNIVQHIWIDASHGANGPLNTFFRNRSQDYGFNMTDNLADNQNVVGNETFTGTWAIFVGDGYALQGSGHFEYGNNTEADGVQPSGTDDLTDFSYYLNDDPSVAPPLPVFWDVADHIPTIGPAHPLNPAKQNPARERFFAGTDLTVGPPSLYQQPADVVVDENDPAGFSVGAVGDAPVGYSWYKDAVLLPGETAATLSISSVTASDAGSYHVVVSDPDGAITSAAATLTVIPADSDGDGIPDAWEELWFPGNLAAMDETTDTDGDGWLDIQEWLSGHDPADGTSFLAFTALSVSGGVVHLEWPSLVGRLYTVEKLSVVVPGTWIPVTVINAPGTDATMQADVPASGLRCYVRLVVVEE